MKIQNFVMLCLAGMIAFALSSVNAGTMGAESHHPLQQGQWNLSFDGGASSTRFTNSSTVLRFSGTGINGGLNPSGVLGSGNDYYFDKLFGAHYFYGMGLSYAYTNNLEWGLEFEGTYAESQRYRRPTRVGFFDQTYASYQSYSGYLTSSYYFNSHLMLSKQFIHPFVGVKLGVSYRPEIGVSNDFLDGVPVTFDGRSNAIFYQSSSSLSGGVYAGLMMSLQEKMAAFIKIGVIASNGLTGHNLFNKTVAIRPIQKASVSNSGSIISFPFIVGIKMFIG